MIRRSSIACTTKMLELDKFLRPVPFSSTQPQANKPGVRRLTSSRRFDYLVVKEQLLLDDPTKSHTVGRLAALGNQKELVLTSGCNLQSPRFKHRGRLPPGV